MSIGMVPLPENMSLKWFLERAMAIAQGAIFM